MDVPGWAWLIFGAVLAPLLVVDLWLTRRSNGTTRKQAIVWSIVWVAVALAFNVFVWVVIGGEAAYEYFAAYLLEKSLSLDNLFVFLVIFGSLNIPKENQHTVLTWGIFGALVFRALFIFAGVAAIERWDWVVYVFGGVLLWAAYRTFREDPSAAGESRTARWLSRHLPVTKEPRGNEFFVKERGKWHATPLLLAIIAVELTDIMFAVDSVPAALSVTHERFLVYSSNAFAILGLRALYLVLVDVLEDLEYLHFGLAAVLGFAGVKMIISEWVHIPTLISIGVIVACVGISVWLSLRARNETRASRGGENQAPDELRRSTSSV